MIQNNITIADCMIVAIHNAVALAGLDWNYDHIKNACIEKGWYIEDHGFNNSLLKDAFAFFGIQCTDPTEVVQAYKITKKVKSGKQFILIADPGFRVPSHAMLAVRGRKGVKLINGFENNCGWKKLIKEFKKNESFKIFAIELKGAA